MDEATAPWWMAGSVAAAWIIKETWSAFLSRRKDRTETDANIELLRGLVERVQFLETSQAAMGQQLDQEIKLRMSAQEEAHRLRLRVLTLESAMRSIGAVIPEEMP